MGLGVWGFRGFRGFRVQGVGFGVQGLRLQVEDF